MRIEKQCHFSLWLKPSLWSFCLFHLYFQGMRKETSRQFLEVHALGIILVGVFRPAAASSFRAVGDVRDFFFVSVQCNCSFLRTGRAHLKNIQFPVLLIICGKRWNMEMLDLLIWYLRWFFAYNVSKHFLLPVPQHFGLQRPKSIVEKGSV